VEVITYGLTARLGTEKSHQSITWINDVVYRVQRHLRAKMIVVHVSRLALYLEATQDEQP
jgi:hypothetical protein